MFLLLSCLLFETLHAILIAYNFKIITGHARLPPIARTRTQYVYVCVRECLHFKYRGDYEKFIMTFLNNCRVIAAPLFSPRKNKKCIFTHTK